MCCEGEGEDDFPALVAQMHAEYRALHRAAPGFDWGDELVVDPPAARFPGSKLLYEYARFASLPDLVKAHHELMQDEGRSTWELALHRVLQRRIPPGTGLVTVKSSGIVVEAAPMGWVLPGRPRRVAILMANLSAADLGGSVAGDPVHLPAGQARLVHTVLAAPAGSVAVALGDQRAQVALATVATPAELHLRAASTARWSVTDASGGAWFPAGCLEKFDVHHRPFFHASEVALTVPAEVELTVAVARGVEFERLERTVTVSAGGEHVLDLEPRRLYDAAHRGWYGGDLHVHVNYSGDVVATPEDAARMQAGEGLHLMNLVAANMHTARIYDQESLETWAGEDLPWSTADQVARYGVEYRNDLLGHVHALGVAKAPSQFQSGHPRSDHPADWPPNSVACEELRSLGGTVGYTHPVTSTLDDGDPGPVFVSPRSVEARELPVDAALGLVDSMDLLGPSPASPEGAMHLYHRLLNCGLRLAPTAGTDVFLSFTHCASLSNPPGFGRAFADLRGRPLTVAGWQEAVRAGRTFVTNGPWLELDVAGRGPGDVIDLDQPGRLAVRARCVGVGAQVLALVGQDGELATVDVTGPETVIDVVVDVAEPGWIAAVARGGLHPDVLAPGVFAHTGPVHIELGGIRIGRAQDATWCLDWIDRVERLAREHGTFHHQHQADELWSVLERGRDFYRGVIGAAGRS